MWVLHCTPKSLFSPHQSSMAHQGHEGQQQHGSGWHLMQVLIPDMARDAQCHPVSALHPPPGDTVPGGPLRGWCVKLTQRERFCYRQHGGRSDGEQGG